MIGSQVVEIRAHTVGRPTIYERAERRRKRQARPEIPSRADVKQLLGLLKRRKMPFGTIRSSFWPSKRG